MWYPTRSITGVHMAGRKAGRDRRERLIALLADPATLDDVLSFVMDGGTVAEWAVSKDVQSGALRVWFEADPDRAKMLADAETTRRAQLTDVAFTTIRQLATTDIRTAFKADGTLKKPKDLPDDLAAAVNGIETTVGEDGQTRTRLRFTPRDRGVELLGRTLSLFKDRLAVDLQVGLADRLQAARKRVASNSKP